ncbi:MAG TPA: glycosyltransferase family 4 protein [Pyrinomonadaceae bacterium]|jgi:glycosyltransferase involved in cell wall biosynthesis|nr:glycosyltransferase family 4 protein [Pyrinomonadaceae bacterium]
MTRIAILTPTITTGDAVSNDALVMRRVLAARGHDAQVYAEGWTVTEPAIRSIFDLGSFTGDAGHLLIYHHSIGWDAGYEQLRNSRCKIAIKYHNITPPEFFAGISPAFEQRCLNGREQMQEMARAAHALYLADSAYNLKELLAEGVEKSNAFVVPPFHHVDRFSSSPADFDVLDAYRDDYANILMVGRVSPNKGHVALIEAFANYRYRHNSRSRLLIVGAEEETFRDYSARLRELLDLLWLREAVVFAGEVSDAALKSYYLLAHVFVTASEHEGFCVPLVEAMAMKVPIVAYASSAIPETVGDAGILWPQGDPHLLGESVNFLMSDEASAMALCELGRRRYEQFYMNERIESEFMRTLDRVL